MICRGRQRGYLLLPVVMAISLMAVIAFMMNYQSAFESDSSGGELESDRARYLAEAGLNHALWQLDQTGCAAQSDIVAAPLGSHSYSANTTTDLVVSNSYTLTVDQDAWIRSDNPTSNNGSNNDQHIRFEGGNTERALFRYDISPLPSGASILSATAWFYIEPGKEHPEGPIVVRRVTDHWTEAGATWENANDLFDDVLLASIPPQPLGDRWVSANLTAQVQSWVNGEPNDGIMLESLAEGVYAEYVSRQGSVGQQPYLEVVVGTPQTSPASVKSVGTLASGISRTVVRGGVMHHQMPTSQLFLQPDAASGIDGGARKARPTSNYGSAVEIQVSGGVDPESMLIRFDLQAIPYGATILSANLDISLNWMSSADPDGVFTVYPMLEDWSEGTGDNWNPGDGANWNTSNGSTGWSWPGNHHLAEPAAITRVDPAFTGWHRWAIEGLVQKWIDGRLPNYGLLITGNDQVTDAFFRSSDNSGAALRPRLTITYACGCGVACVVPQGSGKVLMVVGNFFALDPGEQSIRSLMQGWGYTVDVVDDDTPGFLLDPIVVGYDVVFISESVSSTAVGTKLNHVSAGVVNAEGALNDELGISSGRGTPVGSTLDLIDASHYITSLFPSGPLAFKKAATELATATGSLAPDARALARVGGDGALVVLESGAALEGGGSAAGRRVLVPLGDGGFDPQLTSGGRLILQRALAWAMGTGEPVLTGHWKLDDGTGLTAVDSSGRDNDGTLTGGPVWTGGQLAGALALDGSNDRVLVPDDPTLDISGAITLAAWIRPNATGTQYVIRKAQYDSSDGYELSLSTTGKVFFRLNQDTQGNTWRIDSVSSYPTDGSWMHVAATYDGVTERLYIDGVEEASKAAAISINSNNLDLSLGGQVDGTWVINGAIDDVRLYSGALDAAAIVELAADLPPPGPIAHWKLDDGTGTTAIDSAGGHHGTLINEPGWSAGRLAGALDLDGSDDHISVPHDDTLSLTGAMTFTAWINSSSFGPSYQTILAKDGGGAGSNFWFGTWRRELVFGFFSGGTFNEVFTSGLDLAPNTWYHLAASFDSATDQVRLYLDGSEVHSGTLSAEPTAVSADLRIGRSPDGEYWRGLLDDVRIYDRVLDGIELADLAGGGGGAIEAEYVDQFNAIAYDGNDGLLDWSGSVWQEISDDGAAESGNVKVTPDGLQLDNLDGGDYEGVVRGADLGGYATAVLSFDYSGTGAGGDDAFVAYVSANGGATWVGIEKVLIDGDVSGNKSYNLHDLIELNADFQVRIEILMGFDGSGQHLVLDNVVVDLAGSTGVVDPGGSCTGTYRDEFNATNFSGSDGTLDWSGSPWSEVGEGDGPTAGDIWVGTDQSNYQLRIRDNNNGGEGVERVVDLTGAGSASLSFDYRRENLDNGKDYVAISVSSTGTSGPWSELDRIGTSNDTSYQSYSRDISDHISATTAIRLLSSPKLGNTDAVWFDNIQIQCTP